MRKALVRLLCCFIPTRPLRRKVRSKLLKRLHTRIQNVFINKGSNNKIVIIKDGTEHRINKAIYGLDIIINGNNNVIKLGHNIVTKNSKIEIGSNNVSIEIGENTMLNNLFVRCCFGNAQTVKIGAKTTIFGAHIICDENSACFIGQDCMFSNSINIWCSDGHAIIDKQNKTVINAPKKPVVIGNHVWIGEGARITKNAHIYDNSVVGGGAVAYKDYVEPNVVIAGNPAQIVRRNITWDRRSAYYINKQ